MPNIVKNIFIVCGFRDQPVSKRLVLGVDLKRTESESQSFRARSSLFSKERMLSCMVSFLIFLVVNSFDSINVTRCMRDLSIQYAENIGDEPFARLVERRR